MTTHDVHGHEYAKLSQIKPGIIVQVDNGFTCIGHWQKRIVEQDEDGRLWIKCKSGHHYLDGQADDGEHLIGIYKVEGA